MYAAKYDTRERGKYFMHQLLMTEPTARIMDMYASDMIYMIFKNIQDEFDQTRGRLSRAEDHVAENRRTDDQTPPPHKAGSQDTEDGKHSHATLYWIGAGAAVTGVAAYFLFAGDPKTNTTTVNHNVP